MIKTRDISRGALLDIFAGGKLHRMYILGIRDGRVSFGRTKNGGRGRWWLPYECVLENGRLIEYGEAGRRPGRRIKLPAGKPPRIEE